MRLSVLILLVLSVAVVQTQWRWIKNRGRDIKSGAKFTKEATLGTYDMGRAYLEMRFANHKKSDKYFHARGNYDAARRGRGGVWAATVISDARERYNTRNGKDLEDSADDQRANEWGRSGKDPNHFRPSRLPGRY